MSIIIRLQNLPWSANALDIRQFFAGLQIPEGGVHIVGGELGDAFIAFSTDEDARQAFLRNDGKIKSVQIRLMLSSRTEMQKVIEQARTQSMAAFMLPATTPAAPLPAAVPPVVLPPVIPAAIPEINRDSKERDSEKKKDRKRSRSRSKSRDRRDRSRDRKDRRHRDRSRSRSRDRRDRRRRNRSNSRNRSRDKDTRRKGERAKTTPKRDEVETIPPFQREGRKSMPEVWANISVPKPPVLNIIPPRGISDGPGILGAFPSMDHTMKRTIVNNMGRNRSPPDLNGFNPSREQAFGMSNQQPPSIARQRESWPPANVVPPGGLPVAVTDAQRQSIMNSFGKPTSSFSPPIGNNRGHREDPRKEMNSREKEMNSREKEMHAREKEMPKMNVPPLFQNRPEHNNRRSRFDDINAPPVNACVSMEPFYGSYGDLRRFFNGLSINYKGIKVINDEFGCKTGVCFVQFRDVNIKNEAMKMNGTVLNKIAVKIEHIDDKIFDDAIDRYNPRMDDDNGNEDQFGRSRNISKFFKNNTNPEPPIKDFVCLKVEDLPTFVKEQDILHIFSQHPLISLHLNFKPKGGNVAYVKFSSKEVAKLALAEKNHHVISGKTVTVKPCKDEEFDQVNKDQTAVLEEKKPKQLDTDCLSISSLPSKTNDRDISDFFSDIGVLPIKIHLMSNNMGFTGQAYCEFETKEEATKGLIKNNTCLGPNTVSVVGIPRPEMEGILNNTLPHPGAPTGLPLPPGTPLPPPPIKSEMAMQLDAFVSTMKDAPPKPDTTTAPPDKTAQIKPLIPVNEPLKSPHLLPPLMSQIEPSIAPKDPRGFQGGAFDGPPRNFNGPRHGFNGPRDGSDDGFRPRGGPDRFELSRGPSHFDGPDNGDDDFNGPRGGPDNFGGPRGGPRMSRFDPRSGGVRFNGPDDGPMFNTRDDGAMYNARDEPRFRFSRDGINKNPRFNQNIDAEEAGFEDIPGCTVYMENVPYKAGTNEILDFFEGYNCTNNVSRRYNPNNTPSAEAKVTFYTPDDAFRAVRELHGAKIWGRPIYLRQA